MPDSDILPLPLGEMLAKQAKDNPNYEVFRFAKRGKKTCDVYTYKQLHDRAVSIAQAIQKDVQPGDRIFLIYQPGLEFIAALFACFYLGTIPVPAYPPNPKKLKISVERLNVMIDDSQPALILTSTLINTVIKSIQVKDKVQKRFGSAHEAIDLKQVPIINTQKIPDSRTVADFTRHEANMEDVALLLYTSGSTGHPKGIMVLHQNVQANVIFQRRHIDDYHLTADMNEVIWLPHQHSLCLIGFILRPIYSPTHIILFSPLDFLADPLYWFDLVTEYKAVQTIAPNFALDMVREKATPKRMQQIRLDSLKSMGIGGSTVTQETIDLCVQTCEPYGFNKVIIFPCYGLSEAVVGVCGYKNHPDIHFIHKDELDLDASGPFKDIALSNQIVSNGGWPEDLSEVVIVNPETLEPQKDKVVGEIWVKNKCIAKGYWNKPEATEETFAATTKDGKGPYLRTGDLGFIDNKELYIVERLKDLIVIRGKNFIPNDIEQAIMKTDPRLHVANVAFSYLDGGDEQLVVAAEVEKKNLKHKQELTDKIKETIVKEFEVAPKEVLIVEKDQLPKTVSGKIQRQRFKKQYIDGLNTNEVSKDQAQTETTQHATPATEATVSSDDYSEQALLDVVIYALVDLDVEQKYIDELKQKHDVSFAQLGLDSLKLMEFYNCIFTQLDLNMMDYPEDVMSSFFIYDKTIFDTIASLQKFLNQEVTAHASMKQKRQSKEPIADHHPDLLKTSESEVKCLANKSGKRCAKMLLKQVLTIKPANMKKLGPLERQFLNNIDIYVNRYLPNEGHSYQKDIQHFYSSVLHICSLYNSYGLNQSSIYSKIKNYIRDKAIDYVCRDNATIIKPFVESKNEAKLIFFMHTPLDFGAVFVLIKLLDAAGIKTSVLTKEKSYESMPDNYGLQHCLVWDVTTKRSLMGIDKMVKENRVIFMAPDSFSAVYTKQACRFNVSKLFPQNKAYNDNAIINDLLHKNLFMFVNEIHHIAKHFKLPIYSLSGYAEHDTLKLDIGEPIFAKTIEDHHYEQFLKDILKPKMPHLIDQMDLLLQLQAALNYYTEINEIT